MKNLIAATIVAFSVISVSAAADVKVVVGEPDYFGPIELVGFPEPRLVSTEPVIVREVEIVGEPIYLRVPPGHSKHWEKHCADYDACERQVYFVDHNWYSTVYVPKYRDMHGKPGKGPKD